MSNCKYFDRYEKQAEALSEKINQSQTIKEKVVLAKKLLAIEAELKTCMKDDDPKCRLQRGIVIPTRRKVVETIFKLADLKNKINP